MALWSRRGVGGAHYNHGNVPPSSSLRCLLLLAGLVSACLPIAAPPSGFAQSAAESATLPAKVHHRLLLVLPFDNRTGLPSLDWVSEAVSETFNQRLGASGFDIIARDDRQDE